MTNPSREYRLRQEQQVTRQAYREAAKKLFPMVKVTEHAHVHTMEDGAFVECVVWVAKEQV